MKMKKIAKGFGLCMVGFIGGVGVTSYGVAKYVLTHDQLRVALVEEISERICAVFGTQSSNRYDKQKGNRRDYFYHIIFANHEDAEKALEEMLKLIDKYGWVTVADLCDLAGVACNCTDNKYGWNDLSGSYVKKWGGNDDGYILVIPSLVKEIK